jgi:hypothetical protein
MLDPYPVGELMTARLSMRWLSRCRAVACARWTNVRGADPLSLLSRLCSFGTVKLGGEFRGMKCGLATKLRGRTFWRASAPSSADASHMTALGAVASIPRLLQQELEAGYGERRLRPSCLAL